MDARRAVEELRERSADVDAVALVDADGVTATPEDAAERLAAVARDALAAAEAWAPGREVARLEVHGSGGSLLVLRADGRIAAAATRREPIAALVLHDLRELLAATASRRRASAEAGA